MKKKVGFELVKAKLIEIHPRKPKKKRLTKEYLTNQLSYLYWKSMQPEVTMQGLKQDIWDLVMFLGLDKH